MTGYHDRKFGGVSGSRVFLNVCAPREKHVGGCQDTG